ncbi:neutral zinc metallopeptidase [Nonomuraea sp. NPDC050394]|uniref:neutral zinc metallopeptidase n=1 Tax=Nonomuraea sp. NPDC050394 TaxID=3364363 RepID=UPI0037AD1BD8
MIRMVILRPLTGFATAMLFFSGVAYADPVTGVPELTHNQIYKAKVAGASCALTKGTSASSTKKYVTDLVGCLNKAWKLAIKDFQQVKVTFKEADDKRSCTTGLDVNGSFSEICATEIHVRLAKDWIKAKSDVAVFTSIAHAWSSVVTGQTGIGEAWWSMQNDASESQMNQQNRRYYLQLDCFVGVSAKALRRAVKDWKPTARGKLFWEYALKNKYSGKTANRLYWLEQGYASGKPGACNTWKAADSKVA